MNPLSRGAEIRLLVFGIRYTGLPDDLLFIDLGKFSKKYQSQKLMARIEDNQVIPYYSRQGDRSGRPSGREKFGNSLGG